MSDIKDNYNKYEVDEIIDIIQNFIIIDEVNKFETELDEQLKEYPNLYTKMELNLIKIACDDSKHILGQAY